MTYARPTIYRVLVALNGVKGPKWFQAGDSLMYPAYICMEDDADEVKVCTTSGKPFGVVGLKSDQDLNTAYTAGERIPVWLIGSGVEVIVIHDGAAAASLTKSTILCRSGTTAGTVYMKPAYVSKDTTYLLSEFTEVGDTNHFDIGTCTETKTITSGTAAYVKCLI